MGVSKYPNPASRNYSTKQTSFTTNQNTLQTALDVSGKGELIFLNVRAGGSNAAGNQIKITIDGEVVVFGVVPQLSLNKITQITSDTGFITDGTSACMGSMGSTSNIFPMKWPYNKSLKIEYKADGAINMTTNIIYSIK